MSNRTKFLLFSRNFLVLLIGTLALAFPYNAFGADSWWNKTSTGTYEWNDTANWVNGIVPNSTSDTARFTGNTSYLITGNVTVNVDSSVTVGALGSTITNASTGSLSLTGSTITLENNSADVSTLWVRSLNTTISNDVVMADPHGNQIYGGYKLWLQGSVGGSSDITLRNITFLGGNNTFSGNVSIRHADHTGRLFATSTDAFTNASAGTYSFVVPESWNAIGFGTVAQGTTVFANALNLGNSTAGGNSRILFYSGGNGSTLDVTTSSWTDGGGTTLIGISRADTDAFVGFTASGVGTVKFSGTNFTVSRNFYNHGANSILEFAPESGTQTWSGNITSFGQNLVKSGNGTVILSGNNSYASPTIILAGNLSVSTLANGGSNSNIGASSSDRANLVLGGGTLRYTGANGSTNRSFTLTNATTSAIDVANATTTLTISGTTGPTTGVLRKTGDGTLMLTGANTHSGGTTVNSGTLVLGHATNTLADTGVLTINGGVVSIGTNSDTVGALTLAGGSIVGTTGTLSASSFDLQNGTVSAILGGAGAVTKNDSGTLTLNASNSYSGGTTLNAGTIQIGNANALGSSGTLSFGGGTLHYGTGITTDLSSRFSTAASQLFNIDTNGNDITFASALASSGGSLAKSGSGNLTLSGNSTYSGTTTISAGTLVINSTGRLGGGNYSENIANEGVFQLASDSNQTLAGIISGNGSVVKNGEGTLTLSGNNSYAGGTTVNAGTLVLSGSLATGGTTVNSAGTLAGTGTAAAVTVNSGGIIAPGASAGSVGTLSLSSLTLNGGGGYKWDISNVSGSPGSDWDLISVSGATTISATSGSPFTIYLSGNPTGWNPSVSQPTGWNIIQWGSVTGFDSAAFALNASFFTGATPTGTWAFANSGGYLNLSYEAPGGASIWDSGAGNWSTGANWQSGSVPPPGSALEFVGVGGVSTNNGALTSVNGLIFSASAGGSYTINGTSLDIGGVGISNASGYNQTVSLDLVFTAAQAFDSGSSNLTVTGAITNANQRLTVAGNGTTSIAGAISGTGGLTKSDSGSLVLSANNTFTGTTIISAGTIRLEGSGVLGGGNYSSTISNSGVLVLDTSSNQVLSGAISGNGSLVKNNSSILTLSGSNSHSGGTTLNAGTLQINNASALGTGDFVISGSTTIDNTTGSALVLTTNNTQNWNSNFTFTGSDSLNLGTGAVSMNASRTLTISANTLTVGGAISGSGFSFTKNGTGTLVLSGSNTYTEATTISAGTLTLGASERIADTSNLNVSGTFNMAGFNETLGSIEGAGSIVLGSGTLTTNSSSSTTFSGALSGTGGVLVKQGSGNLTLSGNNTHTGGITVAAGSLLAGSNSNLGDASAALTLDGGTFVMTAAFNTSRAIALGNSGGVFNSTAAGNSTSVTLSGNITGNGPLTIAANGQLNATTGGRFELTGNNSFTGTITITSGIVAPNSANAFGNAANVIILDGGGLLANAVNTIVSNNIVLGEAGGTFRIWGGDRVLTINASISGSGKLDVTDGGPVTLNRANTFTGDTRLMTSTPQTTMNLAHVDALSGSTLDLHTSDRGMVNFTVAGSNTYNIGGLKGSRNLTTLGSNTISLGGNDQSTTYSGTINGTGGLIKSGNETLTLTGSNTYTGGTTVNSGTLVLGHATNTLADTGALTINGGVVSIGSNNDTVGAFTLAGGSIVGTTGTLSASSFNLQNGTVAAFLGGTGAVTKNDSGTLTLNASNSYSGGTTLNAGTLVIGNTAAVGSGAITQADGSSLLVFDTTGTISNAMSIYNVRATQTLTLSGGITVNNATFDVDDGDTLTLSGGVSGSGGVVKNGGGTLVLSGSNSYSGATTVNAGTLNAAHANALGSNTTINVNGGSLLVTADSAINGKNITLNSTATGNGTAASLAFSGTYNGTAGSLTLNANSTIDLGTGGVVVHFADLVMGIYNLSIFNWTGTTLWGGTDRNNTDQFYVNSTLEAGELDRISFFSGIDNSSFVATGFQIMGGDFANQIIPVPEPETWLAAALLLAGPGVSWARARRRREGKGGVILKTDF